MNFKKITHVWNQLFFPVINIILSLILLFFVLYLFLGGHFNIANLSDDNNYVRIPYVLLIVLVPVGYLIDFFGEAGGLIILLILLFIWLIISTITLIRRVKILY